jgi:parallel beta-helix repeat protein
MNRKIALVALIILVFTISLVAQSTTVEAQSYKTITIKSDGSIEGTDRITRAGNTYTFTDYVNGSIIIEKNNIMIDGAGHTIRGSGNITNIFGQVWPNDSPNLETGFTVVGRTHVTIQNLTITDFVVPFCLSNSSYITIQNNKLTYNGQGVRLYNSSNTSILQNELDTSMETGVMADPFSHYNIISENKIIGSNQAILIYSSNNTISGNVLEDGINILYGMYNTIVGNTISGSVFGIELYDSSFNLVSRNSLVKNEYGIWGGSNNTIFENNIQENVVGINSAYNSLIYRNNFINNTEQIDFIDYPPHSIPAPNADVWDNGTQGNYWSDYNGTDANGDGIGDTPYMPYPNNTDHYPLISPINTSMSSPNPLPSPSIPEFPSRIILPLVLTATIATVLFLRRKNVKSWL